MNRIINIVFSPMLILITVGISYFNFTIRGFISGDKLFQDLLILGMITFGMSIILFRKDIPKIELSQSLARKISLYCTFLLLSVSVYMLVIFDYSSSRLVDERFAVPGFGIISSLFTITAVLGVSVIWKFQGYILKSIYFFFLLFVGITIGGKGFFFPIMFGFSLAGVVGIRKDFSLFYIILLLLLSIIALYISVLYADTAGAGVLNLLNNRIFYAADAVVWVAQLSPFDIQFFPITAGTFVADIFLRLVDLRINPRSMGAEVAYLVYGTESGAGPNANLPILAYLVSQGEMLASILFLAAAMTLLAAVRRFSFRMLQHTGNKPIFFAVTIFMIPSGIIDLVVYLQMVFWLLVIYTMCSVRFSRGR